MNAAETVFYYFPELSEIQKKQILSLFDLYNDWNSKINVVSRKDIDSLYEKHVLHSLAIAKYVSFKDGTKIMDLGCGGGFPGIPLAILFPNCRFHLIDSIGKKLKVVDAISDSLGLQNIKTFHNRAEESPYQYDFVVSRAVAPFTDLSSWTKGKYATKSFNEIRNGLICLKGTEIDDPKPKGAHMKKVLLSEYFKEEFFKEKALYHLMF